MDFDISAVLTSYSGLITVLHIGLEKLWFLAKAAKTIIKHFIKNQ